MAVVVFDLDDTLYDELIYVKSGFQAVAQYAQNTFGVDAEKVSKWMWNRLQSHGRGEIFDDLLRHLGYYRQKDVKKCVGVYRLHSPQISLDAEADECIRWLHSFPLYVVTDGNKVVQDRKLKALGLYDRMNFCYVTHRYGIKHAKPSPYCFLRIVEREKTTPDQIVYIGDNPRKDFVGIKKLGFQTVRIMKGQHQNVQVSEEYEAEHRISSLAELNESFIRMITI